MMRVRIFKNWIEPDLLRQTPGGSGIWQDWKYEIGEADADADWVLALNNRFDQDQYVQAAPQRVVALMQEPFVPGFTDWMDRGLESFATVFSSHQPSKCAVWRRSHPAVAWHVNRSYDQLMAMRPDERPRLASWICGGARALPGHRVRLKFLRRVQGGLGRDIDLFGRAVTPIDDKWDGLAPYCYSLAIENTVARDYWTEKIADCFLAWTCPIYHGAPNLEEYFPEEAFIRIDIQRPREAMRTIRAVLDSGDREWRRRLEAIDKARRLVLERWQLFPFMTDQLRGLSGPVSPVYDIRIPAYRPTLASSLRRRWSRWRGTVSSLIRSH